MKHSKETVSATEIKPFYKAVRNPQRRGDGIWCEVLFCHMEDKGYLPFMAQETDGEAHGREIYARCLRGDFGEIGNYVPSEQECLHEALHRRATLIQLATQQITHYQDLIDIDEATQADYAAQLSWKKYRADVNRVDQQAGWPTQNAWPEQPTQS